MLNPGIVHGAKLLVGPFFIGKAVGAQVSVGMIHWFGSSPRILPSARQIQFFIFLTSLPAIRKAPVPKFCQLSEEAGLGS